MPIDPGRSSNSRKWLREGAQGLLDPEKAKPLALVQDRFALAQNRFRKVQETLGRHFLPGSKHLLLHLLVTTFGNFLFQTHSPRRLGLQFLASF